MGCPVETGPKLFFQCNQIRILVRRDEQHLAAAEKAGLDNILAARKASAKPAEAEEAVKAPPAEPCTASIPGIDTSLYEAAVLDGASKWQQAKYITLPALQPIIIMMFILAVGRIFSSDFGLFFQVTQGAKQPLTPIVATFDVKIYQMLNSATTSIGKTSAASMFQAVVGCITILTANAVVRKVDKGSALI